MALTQLLYATRDKYVEGTLDLAVEISLTVNSL